MRAFWTMTKTNCKLLLRSIGFLLCVVLLPVGASALHMVQTSDNYADAHGGVAQIGNMDSTVIMDTNHVSVLFVDAAKDELSELLLQSLAAEDWCSVGHYRSDPLSPDELKALVQDTYDRSFMAGVVYIPDDFSEKLMKGENPSLVILNGEKDGRFDLLKSKINANLSVIAGCALSAENQSQAVSSAKTAFENLPSVHTVVTGNSHALTETQMNQLRDIGYAVAVLSLAFVLTGCFVANLVVTESDNKSLLRIEMSGVTMIKYVASKTLTAVMVTLLQTAVVAAATAVFVGTDVGIPFGSYLLLIGMMGLIYNWMALVFGLFFQNTTFAVYASFGVWVFSNLLAAVYFDFVTLPDWWEKLSLLMPQKWVMITAEMLMKGQNGAYTNYFIASAAFLLVILTAGYLAARLSDNAQKE
ncbi:MAG: ABC transporter permease [Clostridia bacterium]|nr:ABC transporter permease [Clostridia bacterium]MBQ1555378.1 ABC transporter permease [Clostridia bacterium]